jgi:hypothetical protein
MSSTRYYCHILMKLEFSKNTQVQNFIKTRPVGADLFHAEGRTDGQQTQTWRSS